ncbi:hypothetical protein M3B11_02570 [Brevibacterium sp. p3-SID960]|uniref:hypothetical protein n=1 Tax=Brevibacterium sp. p3-SID960 TaxID=2916063 RepID=UPI0021A2754B|nr:hypothetical protein [Brevibacterium sp. p3-SID960]MCT1689851.1 hypothetical protein [Brevibacterium sp. p3-SID960]
MTANLAFAPQQTTSLYPTLGVDFLIDRDLAETGETQGAADHVEWIEATNPTVEDDMWDLAEADEIIAAQGYQRTTEWEDAGDYLVAHIARA